MTQEKPILFSGPMVNAILEGRKTQTRRVVKPQPYFDELGRLWWMWNKYEGSCDNSGGPNKEWLNHCPYGVPGDRLFMTMPAPSWKKQTQEQRFWSRVVKFDNCWEWMGNVLGHARHGYLKIGQKNVYAHRYSWMLNNGDPGKWRVLHKCDVGWCVNPDHLYLGTDADNRRDQSDRGRIRHLCGDHNHASKLNQSQVRQIKQLYASGIKQYDLAEKFNVNQSQISRIVNKKRRSKNTTGALPLLGHRWIEITDIRVERLQDITDEDAFSEGIESFSKDGVKFKHGLENWCWSCNSGDQFMRDTSVLAYEALWDSINAKPKPVYVKKKIVSYVSYPWENIQETRTYRGEPWEVIGNPWLWVVGFRRLQ